MTSKEAITQLNVLSSYDTAIEKRVKYKECIYAILDDLEILDLFVPILLDEVTYLNEADCRVYLTYSDYVVYNKSVHRPIYTEDVFNQIVKFLRNRI